MVFVLKLAAVYFVLVFGAGFVFGVVRTLWVAPRVGARTAELLESPLMLAVITFAARYVAHRLPSSGSLLTPLKIGLIALCFLLFAEVALVIWVRRMSFRQYLKDRDPVATAAYVILLVIFTIMPVFMMRQ